MGGAGRDPGPEDGAHGGALAREAEKRDDFSYFLVITLITLPSFVSIF